MTAKDLKNALLQEAVRGKLVPQIPSEGNARDLLDQIKKEKAKLVKEGKLKKEKPLPPITDDEMPFEIPENWCWCRLGEIAYKLTDGTHRTPKYVEKGIPFLSVKNLSSGIMDFSNVKYITVEEHKELYKRCNPEKGDMLLTKVGTTGVPVINDSDFEFSLFVSVALIKFSHKYIDGKYFLYLLQSPLVQDQAKDNTRGVGNKNWVMEAIANTILVIPPFQEQKYIVKILERFMPFIDEYGKKENELSVLNEEIGKKLKNAILQEAVQGKLVPQNPADGDARALLEQIRKDQAKKGRHNGPYRKQVPIKEKDIPFDIPENWALCRLKDVFDIITGSTPPKDSPEYYGNDIPFYKPSDLDCGLEISKASDNLSILGYEKSRKIPAMSVLVCCIGSIGKTGLINTEGTCNQQINVIINNKKMNMKYIYYSMISPFLQNQMRDNTSMTTLPILNKKGFSECLLTLPPINEQKRIVATLDKLLSF